MSTAPDEPAPVPPEAEAALADAANRSGNPPPASQNEDEDGEDDDEAERPYSPAEKARVRLIREQATLGAVAWNVVHQVAGSQPGRDHVHGNVHNEFVIAAETLAGSRLPISGPVDDEHLEQLRTVQVPNPNFADLVRRLTESPLLLLAGRMGTGRLHAALCALDQVTAHQRGPSPIQIVSTGTALDDALSSLQPGQAYVLDASGAGWASQLDDARIWRILRLVREHDGRLVILLDEPWLLDADLPQLVRHQPPDQAKVTVAHLATHLPDAAAALTAAQRFPQVEDWLQPGGGPAAAVSLAEAITVWWQLAADRATTGHRELGPRPAYLHRRFALRLARALLRQTTQHREQKAWTPRSQSLVLASAVLDGQPLASVIRAAEDLRRRLTQVEVPDRAVGCEVFEAPVRHWLRHADVTDEYHPAATSDAENGSWTTDPAVRLNDPVLASCLLEVAWRDYELLRDPLLDWLRELCRSGNATEHVSAAVAVGRLAAVDFGAIRDGVLEPWARSRGSRAQQSAAWAVENVVLAGGAAGAEAIQLIDSWAASSGWRTWSGLRALGTKVATLDPAKTFRRLAEAARHGPVRQDQLIQDAMVEAYFSGLRCEVLAELHDWSHGPAEQRRRAIRIFLELAVLLVVLPCAADGEQLATLGDLWLLVLRDTGGRHRGWSCLLEWAGRGEATEAFLSLRKYLETAPEVAARLRLWDAVQQSRHAA